ncbi:hypothetical protein ACAG25_04915 [Mycobacterium sp. pV006]|uniref:hypothetical protein n=1 Tax=Mycobacterium sp. pV006 TaxID=3238983 RepID=UPI00351B0173
MKKKSLASVVAAGMVAGLLGFAAPAQANDVYDRDLDYTFGGSGNSWAYDNGYGRDDLNNPWLHMLYPDVKVPSVDNSVRN